MKATPIPKPDSAGERAREETCSGSQPDRTSAPRNPVAEFAKCVEELANALTVAAFEPIKRWGPNTHDVMKGFWATNELQLYESLRSCVAKHRPGIDQAFASMVVSSRAQPAWTEIEGRARSVFEAIDRVARCQWALTSPLPSEPHCDAMEALRVAVPSLFAAARLWRDPDQGPADGLERRLWRAIDEILRSGEEICERADVTYDAHSRAALSRIVKGGYGVEKGPNGRGLCRPAGLRC